MQKNFWLIKCSHTPESLDRVMMVFRKRGLTVESAHYRKVDSENATCEVVFEEDSLKANSIYKNLIRLEDIFSVEIQEN